MLWGNNDPLFPQSNVVVGKERLFTASGLKKEHWRTATPIRDIFRKAFAAAGLPYYNPHSFRNTLARLGETLCQSPEEFKAWSQNLGHESVLTTLYSYGHVQEHRQREIMKQLRSLRTFNNQNAEDILREVYKAMGVNYRQTEKQTVN